MGEAGTAEKNPSGRERAWEGGGKTREKNPCRFPCKSRPAQKKKN